MNEGRLSLHRKRAVTCRSVLMDPFQTLGSLFLNGAVCKSREKVKGCVTRTVFLFLFFFFYTRLCNSRSQIREGRLNILINVVCETSGIISVIYSSVWSCVAVGVITTVVCLSLIAVVTRTTITTNAADTTTSTTTTAATNRCAFVVSVVLSSLSKHHYLLRMIIYGYYYCH